MRSNADFLYGAKQIFYFSGRLFIYFHIFSYMFIYVAFFGMPPVLLLCLYRLAVAQSQAHTFVNLVSLYTVTLVCSCTFFTSNALTILYYMLKYLKQLSQYCIKNSIIHLSKHSFQHFNFRILLFCSNQEE